MNQPDAAEAVRMLDLMLAFFGDGGMDPTHAQ